MAGITRAQALENFRILITEVDAISTAAITQNNIISEGFDRWRIAAITAIQAVFGIGHQNSIEFQQITYLPPSLPGQGSNTNTDFLFFLFGLKRAKEMLEGMQFSIAAWWPEDKPVNSTQPIVFISYGGSRHENVLAKIKEFLIALGASPIIVAELPNSGQTLDDKVNQYMQICNSAIVLLTAEDLTDQGEKRVRPNVDHEVGCLQQSVSINKRIIYFKENGVTLPSNYRNIAWYDYNNAQIDTMFIKITRELKAFGF